MATNLRQFNVEVMFIGTKTYPQDAEDEEAAFREVMKRLLVPTHPDIKVWGINAKVLAEGEDNNSKIEYKEILSKA